MIQLSNITRARCVAVHTMLQVIPAILIFSNSTLAHLISLLYYNSVNKKLLTDISDTCPNIVIFCSVNENSTHRSSSLTEHFVFPCQHPDWLIACSKCSNSINVKKYCYNWNYIVNTDTCNESESCYNKYKHYWNDTCLFKFVDWNTLLYNFHCSLSNLNFPFLSLIGYRP